MEERVQKIIAAAGTVSRRKAEELIRDGKVTVNGRPVSLGAKADPERDRICIAGKALHAEEQKVYLMVNKPVGYLSAVSDDRGRKCVTELVTGLSERIYPVGRLDLNSEGLLLLTNDGEFTNRMLHPSFELDKTYLVRVSGDRIEDRIPTLQKPLEIDGYRIRPAQVSVEESSGNGPWLLRITIHEGRNRQIRKMCEIAGLRVLQLKRIQEGPLKLGALKSGKWRYLTEEEKELLEIK